MNLTDEELRYVRGMHDNSMSISTLMEWWGANGSRLTSTWVEEGLHKNGADPDDLSPELLRKLGIDASESEAAVAAPSEEEYAVLSVMIEGYVRGSPEPGLRCPLIVDQFRPYRLWGGLSGKTVLRKELTADSHGRTAEDDLRAKRRGAWPVESRLALSREYQVAPNPSNILPSGMLQVPAHLSLHRVGFGAGGLEAMTGLVFSVGMAIDSYLAVFHREPAGWRVKEELRSKIRFSYYPRPAKKG